MVTLLNYEYKQIPLFHISHQDDRELLNNPEAEWFRILREFPWQAYVTYAAAYYDALYEFNIREEQRRQARKKEQEVVEVESKEDARERLLFDRETMKAIEEREVIYRQNILSAKVSQVKPESVSPGLVPMRLGGKKPKCFFSMFKSFIGATLMGFAAEPEEVYRLLVSNPSFVRVCGFAPKFVRDEYCYLHIPSRRKLEQFDQIMKEWGLWDKIKIDEVRSNLESGVIKKEGELVGDTTHYHGYSGFETLTYTDDKGKDQKKSQSRLTKKCRCKERDKCNHPWELADEGAGTIVKSTTKMYWGHKASVLGFPRQGVPLDAAAVTDAAIFDGETLYPHVERLFDNVPEIKPCIKRVLYDSACDDKDLKEKFHNNLGIELKTSLNPRRKKEITEDLPRGIKKITPYGVPICIGEYEMDYKGVRYENEKFIYQSPMDSKGLPVCSTCEYQINCCPNSLTGRTINISFDLLPHINSDDPPMAKRYKAIMTRRPSVERMIKRLKCDLGDDRLSKRGNDSFQAYLDKTMIAFHILLRN